jgi:hypothetical protein
MEGWSSLWFSPPVARLSEVASCTYLSSRYWSSSLLADLGRSITTHAPTPTSGEGVKSLSLTVGDYPMTRHRICVGDSYRCYGK